MRKKYFLMVAIVAAAVAGFVACTNSSAKEEKNEGAMTQAEMVKRGEYLVSVIGCDDCHSPKKMGPGEPEIIPELRLSGYPSSRPLLKPDSSVIKNGWMLFGPDLTSAAGPWGVSYAGNLTSDPTGIGNWTEENFLRAIRKGKLKGLEGGRPLLPPMPWFIYKNMTDDDLKSIFAFLKTTKPVQNVVPAPRQLSDFN